MTTKDRTDIETGAPDPSRRRFMKSVGGGALGAATVSLAGLPVPADAAGPNAWLNAARPRNRGFWNRVRAAFALDPRVTYMNIGTTGSMPRHVLRAYDTNNRAVARDPRETLGGSTAMREELAPQYGCNPDELVISGNTTEGMCMALNGLTLGEGDAIITTNHEHPSGTAPMALLRDRRGVAIREVHLPVGDVPENNPEHYVDLFRAEVVKARAEGLNPALFVFSAPTYLTGTMLPIRKLADLAIQEGIYTLVDGAHATGMFDLDFHALGVDFFAGSGHKWQCGPGGTGIWYIRNQTDSNPLPLPPFYPTHTLLYDLIPGGGNPDGNRTKTGIPIFDDMAFFNQLHGNPNYPAYRALADSARFWTDIGRQDIEDYLLGLSSYLKDRVSDHWGRHTLYSATHPEMVSGLTAFTPFPDDRNNQARSDEFVTRLREDYGFVVRNTSVHIHEQPDEYPIRVSTHLFHDDRDVDAVVAAMIDLTAAMGG